MIDMYSAQRIARMEHELMKQSLARVSDYSDYDFLAMSDQPGWVWRQIGRLLYALRSGLTALGKRLKHGQDTALKAPFTRQEQNSVPN
jgi:hypothetical protein